MPKLAIYIPKKDMREIEKWRKKLNFSQVFMTALRREIRERSQFMKVSDDQMARAAEHYRRALTEDAGPLVEVGYQTGCTHVLECKLSPEVIRRLLELNDSEAWQAPELEEIVEAMGGARAFEKCVGEHGLEDRTHPTWRESICRGYTKGVSDTWARVCERMRSPS
jgi:hypothetical protein